MIADYNVRSFLSEQPADLTSDARVAADDQCLLILETIHAVLGHTEP
jgi:hypothetical protein